MCVMEDFLYVQRPHLLPVAVNRDRLLAEEGDLHLHCTCADAVFRAEPEGRFCKHLRGLLDLGRPTNESLQADQPCPDVGA